MNPLSIQQDNQRLFLQRNFLAVMGCVLLLVNVILAACLYGRSEKTIIVPAQLNQEVSLSGSEFSDSYMEEMTNFFIGLLLDLTPDNVGYKSSIVLKHVEPSAYNDLQKYFKEEEAKHKKYNLATHFSVTGILEVSPLEREVEGVLTSRFGDTGKKDQQLSCRIGYKNRNGRLLLEKFELLEEKRK